MTETNGKMKDQERAMLLDEIETARKEGESGRTMIAELRRLNSSLDDQLKSKNTELARCIGENEKMKIQVRRLLFVAQMDESGAETRNEDQAVYENVRDLHQQNIDLSNQIEQMEKDTASAVEAKAQEMFAKERLILTNDYEMQLKQARRETQHARQECAKLRDDVILLEGREKMLDRDNKDHVRRLQERMERAEQECIKLREEVLRRDGREKMLEQDHKEFVKQLQERLDRSARECENALSQCVTEISKIRALFVGSPSSDH